MRTLGLIPLLTLAACKPPPTDADMDRDMPVEELEFASKPLASPDIEGAIWAGSATPGRIVYGVPGSPALMAMQCIEDSDDPDASSVIMSRISPADEGAGALMALIGNGDIGRVEMNAVETEQGIIWQGEFLAKDTRLNALSGPREVTATLPGAGMVTLNPSQAPMRLLAECRGEFVPPPGLEAGANDAEKADELDKTLDALSEETFADELDSQQPELNSTEPPQPVR
ncbi:MAG: hypothetical protein ABJP70_07580 [Erythrobacter sp.]